LVSADPGDADKPLLLDLGCGLGVALLDADPMYNAVGVDASGSMVNFAAARARRTKRRAIYVRGDALEAAAALASYPGPIETVYVSFPTPDAVAGARPSILTDALLDAVHASLGDGALVVTTQLAAVADGARERAERAGFAVADAEPPPHLLSETEAACRALGRPVFSIACRRPPS